jgi:hypothetical protein
MTRCERTIGGREPPDREIKAAWQNTINRRLSEDKTTATKILQCENYTKLIKNTWEKALTLHHGSLPDNWLLREKGF